MKRFLVIATMLFTNASFANTTDDMTTDASMHLSTPITALCRDCGFPMRMGEGRYLMPNKNVVVEIDKVRLPSRFEEVRVRLVDRRSGEVIAEGVSKQRRGRKTIHVAMADTAGNPIDGYVQYVDSKRKDIAVKFTCKHCLISDLIGND